MTVSALHQKGTQRFELVLETGETLHVSLNDVADFSLYSGRELGAEELASLRASAALSHTKERALRILNARAMSERELYDRLVEKGETEENAAAALSWLVELHFLDDVAYASSLVRRCAAKGFGLRRVRDELYRHKVPRELWDEALAEMPEQEDAALRLLRSKLRGASVEDRTALKRATDALARKGFDWEEIRVAVERYAAGILHDSSFF